LGIGLWATGILAFAFSCSLGEAASGFRPDSRVTFGVRITLLRKVSEPPLRELCFTKEKSPKERRRRLLCRHPVKSESAQLPSVRERYPPERMSVAPCRVVRTDIRCSADSACTASTGRCHDLAARQSQMAGVRRLFFGDFSSGKTEESYSPVGARPDADEQGWKETPSSPHRRPSA
jgi:hypothetical protein